MKKSEIEDVASNIVDSAIQVHRNLGPGLLESAYQRCLGYELNRRGYGVRTEVALPLKYGDLKIATGYRIDMIVNQCIVVENKTVDELAPVHEAQILTYLKLTGCRLGFLLNWHVPLMREGIRRMVLDF